MSALPLTLLLAAAAASEPPLTEARAVELALAGSASLQALAHEVEEMRAMVDVDTKLDNPELRVSNLRSDRLVAPAFGEEEYRSHPFEDVSVGVRWKPPNLGARSAGRAEAERRVDQARAELEMARRDLVARVRSLHAAVVGYDAQIAAAHAALEQRDRLRGLVKLRLERQAATVLDQSMADMEYLEAMTKLQELESRRRADFHELLVLVGMPPGARPELVGDPAVCEPQVEGFEELFERAKAGSPWLSSFKAQVAEADAESSKLQLEQVPWFEHLQLSYVLGGAEESGRVELGFALPLPVLDWNRADLRAAQAKRARHDEQYRAELQALAGNLRRALEEREEQATLVDRYREAEPLLAAGLERLQRAVEVAEADLLQIAEVQTRVLSARRAHLKAALECRLAQIELERLVGPSRPDTTARDARAEAVAP